MSKDAAPNDPIEERLREVVIGEIEPQTIVVADYEPGWPERFRHEEARIRAALGGAALSVEHIGCTSVPGLAAKPIVDVLLMVEDSGDEASYLPALEEAGYVLSVREPDFDEHRMFRTPAKDVHTYTSSQRARRRSTATCCASACARIKGTGNSTLGRSASWRTGSGRACSTTPRPRPRSSKASSPGPPRPGRPGILSAMRYAACSGRFWDSVPAVVRPKRVLRSTTRGSLPGPNSTAGTVGRYTASRSVVGEDCNRVNTSWYAADKPPPRTSRNTWK
jgi:GrpB-like predicted nucleotidyltransferase (UPF0157 family)